MKKIDINILHKNHDECNYSRQSGNTTYNLDSVLRMCELNENSLIFYVSHNGENTAFTYFKMMIEFMNTMKEKFDVVRKNEIKIGSNKVVFTSYDQFKNKRDGLNCFLIEDY